MHGVILLASFVEAGVKMLGSEVTYLQNLINGGMIYGIPMVVARDGTIHHDTQCSYSIAVYQSLQCFVQCMKGLKTFCENNVAVQYNVS